MTYPVESRLTPVNHWDGRTSRIAGIVIHSTRSGIPGNDDYTASINWFWNPASKVSAHVVVARDGRRCVLVQDGDTAWHAGALNPATLGIEVEQATPDEPFTESAIRSTAEQCDLWCRLHNVPRHRAFIWGHDETAQGQANGKSDPGELWPWSFFMELLTMPDLAKENAVLKASAHLARLALEGKWQDLANALKFLGITPS